MSISVEFTLPPNEFVLAWTVQHLPETRIDIERMVFDSLQQVTPYLWVSSDDFATFEDTIDDDPTVDDLVLLDEYDGRRLYRATWRKSVRGILLALSEEVATILKAIWNGDEWNINIMFADQESLSNFHHYCATYDIPLELTRLEDSPDPFTPVADGLTGKQREAVSTALDMGYFEIPRECSLAELADELGISENATSARLRRGYTTLIERALAQNGN